MKKNLAIGIDDKVLLRIYFDFNDWWIGYYRGAGHHFVCPLPTIVISWKRRYHLEKK